MPPSKQPMTRTELARLYLPPEGEFVDVDVPELPFFVVDGDGAPDGRPFQRALAWLVAAVEPLKRDARRDLGRRFVEPPLEALWWSDDWDAVVRGRREGLTWRLMIAAPPWADEDTLAGALARAEAPGKRPPSSLRLHSFREGACVQTLFVGPNEACLPTLERLYHEELPARGLAPRDAYHEVYLDDPARVRAARGRTVLRQAVGPA